jgi:dolichyl-phosphate-mannose-protein mannosyltransferase
VNNGKFRSILFLSIPLILSAFTHLWNPLGFPSVHIDEAHYMRRAMLVLDGSGPQESANSGYPRTYDHPYFGQLFLAGLLGAVGYPNSLHPTPDVQSIEMLHLVPRVIMGILAVVDTFLIYKISERRYNKNVALIASVLFAVMPMTWILRRIYLDTLLMPLLLSSILFAIYIRGPKNNNVQQWPRININKNLLVLLSGIFLGLAIYTKIPAFTMIPVVGYLVVSNSNSNRKKTLALWLIPVILIPLLWPAYAFSIGHGDLWLDWVLWQTGRHKPLVISLTNFFEMDPVIMIIGIIGLLYSVFRKDLFVFLWIIPFLIFSYFIGWVQYFHLIPIFPAFCIGGALLIESFSTKIKNKKVSILMPVMLACGIAIFGFTATSLLITKDVNSGQFAIYSSIARNLAGPTNANNTGFTIIGSHWWDWNSYWITQYVLDEKHDVIDPHFDPQFRQEIKTKKVLFIDDEKFLSRIARDLRGQNIMQIKSMHNDSTIVGTYLDNVTKYDNGQYPYNIMSIMVLNENHPVGVVQLRRNY